MQKYAVLFLMTLVVYSSAPAAIITWGAVQDTTASAANDVVDGGDVVLAINGQSQSNTSPLRQGSVTLDGILFESPDAQDFLGNVATPTLNALSLPSGRTAGDADYDTFLTHVAFADVSQAGLAGTDVDLIYPIAGLSVATDYLVQLWYTDERPTGTNRSAIFGDNETPNHTVVVPGQGANGFGSFVVGSFTADSSTQDLRIGIENAPRAHLTGILVRAVAIPEPSSFAFLALGMTVAVGRRRRRSIG
ncbi:PEP-CTERM sorting domain-containing protein [Stieleria magnilauensis]|uniref:Ice-binding protein C-terminal domain-containing protein n=1 Tax=Stieleria magnilauensis TaxID=2527963 RepID=A0ABX5XHY6_9BACT|nr:hypothetical protein TBK1r_03640 [Planctomycetes bacterium TBK1r]